MWCFLKVLKSKKIGILSVIAMDNRAKQILDIIKPGEVLNISSKPKWWQFWLNAVYSGIRWYQKNKYKNRWDDIHSMLYLGSNCFISCESPVVVFRILNNEKVNKVLGQINSKKKDYILEFELDSRSKYRICVLLDRNGDEYKFSQEEMHFLQQEAVTWLGEHYDYGQLIDILLKKLFPNIGETAHLVDMGDKHKVCSVLVHYLLVAWWKKFQREDGKNTIGKDVDRPLGGQYIETTCPADFANKFKVIAEGI